MQSEEEKDMFYCWFDLCDWEYLECCMKLIERVFVLEKKLEYFKVVKFSCFVKFIKGFYYIKIFKIFNFFQMNRSMIGKEKFFLFNYNVLVFELLLFLIKFFI